MKNAETHDITADLDIVVSEQADADIEGGTSFITFTIYRIPTTMLSDA